MPVQFARPDVASLTLRVFSRGLHPELFEAHAGLQLTAGRVSLHIHLCTAGHWLAWRRDRQAVSEAITETSQAVSPRSCVLEQKVRGCRTRSLSLPNGLRYGVGCQLETLEADLFLQLHDELRQDCETADLAYEYPNPNRFSPGALSVIRTEVARTSAVIHTYHTFPEHCAIVKTQSLFEWD
jgi:hypothetical protein